MNSTYMFRLVVSCILGLTWAFLAVQCLDENRKGEFVFCLVMIALCMVLAL